MSNLYNGVIINNSNFWKRLPGGVHTRKQQSQKLLTLLQRYALMNDATRTHHIRHNRRSRRSEITFIYQRNGLPCYYLMADQTQRNIDLFHSCFTQDVTAMSITNAVVPKQHPYSILFRPGFGVRKGKEDTLYALLMVHELEILNIDGERAHIDPTDHTPIVID